jgi:hypothetical protein
MTYKRQMERQIQDMYCVIYHFEKNNQVVIERWTNQFGYTFNEIISELNEMIDEYNRKYGKRWGMLNRFTKIN